MRLDTIIKIASAAYDADDLVWQYYKYPRQDHGDGLAKFIAREIEETYDREAPSEVQLAEAIRVMSNAALQVQNVVDDLTDRLVEETPAKKGKAKVK